MRYNLQKTFSISFFIFSCFFILLFFNKSVNAAWVAPTQDPPGGNMSGPIFASSTSVQIIGDIGNGGKLRLQNSDSGNSAELQLMSEINGSDYWSIYPYGGDATGNLSFGYGPTGNNRFFIIDTSGNIGIGSSTPSVKLSVDGSAVITGSLDVEGSMILSGGISSDGAINMNNNIISNIGNAGTYFDSNGGLTLASNLSVNGTGDTTIAGDLQISGSGTTTIENNLWVKDVLRVGAGSVNISQDGMDFTGSTTITSGSGDITIEPASGGNVVINIGPSRNFVVNKKIGSTTQPMLYIDSDAGTLNLTGDIDVEGDMTLGDAVINSISASGTMEQTGETIFNGIVNIISSTTNQLKISFDEDNYYNTDISSQGRVGFSATGTDPRFTFENDLIIGDASGFENNSALADFYVHGNLQVDGLVQLQDTVIDNITGSGLLTQIGNTNLYGVVNIITTSTPQFIVGFDENNYYNTDISSQGKVIFNATGTSASFVFEDDLIVGDTLGFGNTSSSSDLYVEGNLEVDGNIWLGNAEIDNITVTGTFTQDGDLNLSNHIISNIGNSSTDFTSTGGLNLRGGFAINTDKFSVASSSGNTVVAGTLDVASTTTTANLEVTGNSIFNSSLDYIDQLTDGAIIDEVDVSVTSDGSDVTLNIEKQGGGAFLVQMEGEVYSVGVASTTLADGTDPSPQVHYVYMNESLELDSRTNSFPTSEKYAPIATLVIQSAPSVAQDGVYKLQVLADHIYNGDNGHLTHINQWIRDQHATWLSGADATFMKFSGATLYSGDWEDEIYLRIDAAQVSLLHEYSFPSFNTLNSSEIYVVNDPDTPYRQIQDLTDLTQTSLGIDIKDGRRYSLVVWGAVNETTNESKLFINLPSGVYRRDSEALEDPQKYSNYNIPADYRGTGFLIVRITLRYSDRGGDDWRIITDGQQDLRGQTPSIFAGGTAGITTEFSNNDFVIYDSEDSTSDIKFDFLEPATPGTTRILTVQNTSGTIAYLDDALLLTGGDIVGNIGMPNGGTIGTSTAKWTFDGTNGDISTLARLGIGTSSPLTSLHINATDGLIIPVGTNTDRPTSSPSIRGLIRYNSESSQFEGYDGANWGSLGGIIDVDQDTYISAENSPGADNDQLRFFASSTQQMIINSNGSVGIGTTSSDKLLRVGNNFSVDNNGDIVANSLNIESGLSIISTTTLNGVPYNWPDSDGNEGQVLGTDGSGQLSWKSGVGVFVGRTPGTYFGDLSSSGGYESSLSGYMAANDICDSVVSSSSHMCYQSEIINTLMIQDFSSLPEYARAWINSGGPKYAPAPKPVNDCEGWTDSSTSRIGSFWRFKPTGADDLSGGVGAASLCNSPYALACCK